MQHSHDDVYERIRQNPQFHALVARRGRFAWTLAAVVIFIFYGFVLTVAFNPGALGAPITDGSMVTVGIVAGLFMFVFFWLLTAFYVRRANGEFDALTNEIVSQAWQGGRQ